MDCTGLSDVSGQSGHDWDVRLDGNSNAFNPPYIEPMRSSSSDAPSQLAWAGSAALGTLPSPQTGAGVWPGGFSGNSHRLQPQRPDSAPVQRPWPVRGPADQANAGAGQQNSFTGQLVDPTPLLPVLQRQNRHVDSSRALQQSPSRPSEAIQVHLRGPSVRQHSASDTMQPHIPAFHLQATPTDTRFLLADLDGLGGGLPDADFSRMLSEFTQSAPSYPPQSQASAHEQQQAVLGSLHPSAQQSTLEPIYQQHNDPAQATFMQPQQLQWQPPPDAAAQLTHPWPPPASQPSTQPSNAQGRAQQLALPELFDAATAANMSSQLLALQQSFSQQYGPHTEDDATPSSARATAPFQELLAQAEQPMEPELLDDVQPAHSVSLTVWIMSLGAARKRTSSMPSRIRLKPGNSGRP